MNINETTNFNGNISIKDANGVDQVAAYLSANINTSTSLSINVNVQNASLLTATATSVAGQTAEEQYAEFETAVKTRAKDLGYVIFA